MVLCLNGAYDTWLAMTQRRGFTAKPPPLSDCLRRLLVTRLRCTAGTPRHPYDIATIR